MPAQLFFKYKKTKLNSGLRTELGKLTDFHPNTSARFIHAKLRAGYSNVKKWKFLGPRGVSAYFFSTPKGIIVARAELPVATYPLVIGKRPKYKTGVDRPRRMLEVIDEPWRRGVRMEEPVGEIVAKDWRVFYFTKLIKGKTLFESLRGASEERAKQIAKGMAQAMAQAHQKGVLHSHPNGGNWIIDKNTVRLIDPKGIRFKEEYPFTSRLTGRTTHFEDLIKQEIHAAQTWLEGHEQAKQAFREEYALQKGLTKRPA